MDRRVLDETFDKARAIFTRIAQPDRVYGNWGLAKTWYGIGLVHSRTGHHTESLRAYEQAHEILERIIRLDPGDSTYPSELALTHTALGDLHASVLHQPDQAVASCEHARSLLAKLVTENPEVTEYRQLHGDRPAHQGDQPGSDGQAQAGAAVLARQLLRAATFLRAWSFTG